MKHQEPHAHEVRIHRMFKAYPRAHPCVLRMGALDSSATIIAMNNTSARVRCGDGSRADAFPFGMRLDLRTGLRAAENMPGEVPCRVSWKHGAELGLEFESTLRVGIGDLQRAFDR